MANTTGDALYYPTGSGGIQLVTDLANMQNTNQLAFNKRAVYEFRWANTTARTGQTGMRAGDHGYQVDSGMEYIYTGTSWQAIFDDTGWQSFSFNTGYFNSYSGDRAQYRRFGNVVYLRGFISRTAGTSAISTLPAGYRPTATHTWGVPGGSSSIQRRLSVLSDGTFNVAEGGEFTGLTIATSFVLG